MVLTYTTRVDNPIFRSLAQTNAMHQMTMNVPAVWFDWCHFLPDRSYQDRRAAFNKRFTVLKEVPNVKVVDDWYSVTSVDVTLRYNSNERG